MILQRGFNYMILPRGFKFQLHFFPRGREERKKLVTKMCVSVIALVRLPIQASGPFVPANQAEEI